MENEIKRLTAVQWLLSNIEPFKNLSVEELSNRITLIENALELERTQIIEAHNTGKYIPERKGTEYYDDNFQTKKL